ncbi:MAG TPA: ABC transporter permease [Bacteroidales bacterium]|jgi:molybdate/tungstate transport system permease protein|nr:ABC transporter permease [Bacteroidales bacterium]
MQNPKMKQYNSFQLTIVFLSGLLLLFIIAPIIGMFISTGYDDVVGSLKDREVVSSIWITLLASIGATLLFSLAAIPFAYFLARKSFPLKKIVIGIIDLPIVIPHTAAGIALLGIISRNTFLGKAAHFIGFEFVGSIAGIMIAMAFVSLPYLINAAMEGFLSVPERLEQAAMNLGASQTKTFFKISLPLAWRSILSGFVLMFARGISEFGAVVIIAYHPMTTPVLIYERFGSFGLQYAKPIAVIVIFISLLVFILLRWLANKKKNA